MYQKNYEQVKGIFQHNEMSPNSWDFSFMNNTIKKLQIKNWIYNLFLVVNDMCDLLKCLVV